MVCRFRRFLHGEAVAIGTLLELAAAERFGWTPRPLVDRARDLTARLGLPVTVARADVAAAWPFTAADKKRTLSRVRLPVVASPGVARIERVELDALRDAALASMA